jgi:cobalt-zinc-cadmium efflux system membrane fusion protein
MKFTRKIRRTKAEIRKKTKVGKTNLEGCTPIAQCCVRISDFFRASDFGFRILFALCLFSSIVALSGCSRQQTSNEPDTGAPAVEGDKITFPTNAPQLSELTTEPAEEQKAAATDLSGRLAWDDDATARVFPPVSGRIVKILANPGQIVAAGDVLAKIQSPDFGQAQADARKAVADFKQADRVLNRTSELLAHGAAADKDVEAAENDYDHAVSEKERALATLSLYGGKPDESEVNGIFSLRTPVAGMVVDKAVSPGQEVRSDQVGDKPLFVVSDPARLWLFLDVTEADAASLNTNQEVLVRSRALPDKTFHGHVEVIGEGLDPTTRTIKARCLVDNPEKLLRAEMYVSVDVTATVSGVDIPTKAVFLKNNSPCVFVETTPGQFQRRSVKLGAESNGRSVIVDGVASGQRVVTDGCLLLEAILEGENS